MSTRRVSRGARGSGRGDRVGRGSVGCNTFAARPGGPAAVLNLVVESWGWRWHSKAVSSDLAQWHDLFAAAAATAGALAGLIFVSVSINIDRILKLEGVAERGLQTVLLLLGALVVSILALMPQPIEALGIEVLATGIALTTMIAVTSRKTLGAVAGHPSWVLSRLGATLPGSVPYLVGGASLLLTGAGLVWVVIALLGAMVGSVVNGWVLLVEILR